MIKKLAFTAIGLMLAACSSNDVALGGSRDTIGTECPRTDCTGTPPAPTSCGDGTASGGTGRCVVVAPSRCDWELRPCATDASPVPEPTDVGAPPIPTDASPIPYDDDAGIPLDVGRIPYDDDATPIPFEDDIGLPLDATPPPPVTDARPDPCAPLRTSCSGACVDLATDSANCGACGRRCPSGSCVSSACLP